MRDRQMKTLNTVKNSLFTITLLAATIVPTVNATQVTQQLQVNAQTLLAQTLDENLNEVVTTINGDLKKDIIKTAINDQSLVLELAASQLNKDDKIVSSVGE